jgi:glyoxylase-like metal-dependent hydrolase (beta-lactamase superfamily II)
VFDCGLINVNRAGTERYNVTPEEVGETRFVVPCFLIAHPRGTLMWDLGVIPDDTVEARVRGEQGNPTATSEAVTPVKRTLTSQLAEVGYKPEDITHFAISHAHGDHVASANLFATSLNLASTGRVMLASDLYHYPQERTLHRQPPSTEFSVEQSAASRMMIEEYLKRTKTEILIEHDFAANAKLKKAPAYCE